MRLTSTTPTRTPHPTTTTETTATAATASRLPSRYPHLHLPSMRHHLHQLLVFFLLLLLSCTLFLHHHQVEAITVANEIPTALALLSPLSDRSVWTYSTTLTSASHASNILPFGIPAPPPASSYPSGYQVASMNGIDQYIDFNAPKVDGGSAAIQTNLATGWSFSTWFYLAEFATSVNEPKIILLSCTSTNTPLANKDLFIWFDASDGKIHMRYPDNRNTGEDTTFFSPSGYAAPQFGTWQHISVSYSPSIGWRTFLGGIPSSSFTNAGSYQQVASSQSCYWGKSDQIVFAKDMMRFSGAVYATLWMTRPLESDEVWALAAPHVADTIYAILQTVTVNDLPTVRGGGSTITLVQPLTTQLSPWRTWTGVQLLQSQYMDLYDSQVSAPTVLPINPASNTLSFFYKSGPLSNVTAQTILYFRDSPGNKILKIEVTNNTQGCIRVTYGDPTSPLFSGYVMPAASFSLLTFWNQFTLIITSGSLKFFWNDAFSGSYSWKNTYSESSWDVMLLGKDYVTGQTTIGSYLGLTIWPELALQDAQVPAMVIPKIAFIHSIPTSIPEGSQLNLMLRPVQKVQVVAQMSINLGGYILRMDYNQPFPIPAIGQTEVPAQFRFAMTSNYQAMTIYFNVAPYQAALAPTPNHCIEIIKPSQVIDVGLTLYTATQLLQTADFYLSFQYPFPNSINGLTLVSGPSGMSNATVLNFPGTTLSQNLEFISSTITGYFYPGITSMYTYTIVAWIMTTSQPSKQAIFTTGAAMEGSDNIYFELLNGLLTFTVKQGTDVICTTQYLNIMIQNKWTHVAAVMGGGGCTVFVDGVPYIPDDYTVGSKWTDTWVPVPTVKVFAKIGAYNVDASALGFAGQMANFALYNRQLSIREIVFLASVKPSSIGLPLGGGQPRRIALTGVQTAQSLLTNAAYFTPCSSGTPAYNHASVIAGPSRIAGTGIMNINSQQYAMLLSVNIEDTSGAGLFPVISPIVSPTQGVTIAVWVSLQRLQLGDAIVHIGASQQTGANSLRISQLVIALQPSLVMQIFDSTNTSQCMTTTSQTTTTISIDQWLHVTAQFNPTLRQCFLFIDGITAAIGTFGGAATVPTFNSSSVMLGGNAAPIPRVLASYAGFAVWTRVLSLQEIFQLASNPPLSLQMNPAAILPSPASQILLNADYDIIPPPHQLSANVPQIVVDSYQLNGDNQQVFYFPGASASQTVSLYPLSQAQTGLPYFVPFLTSPRVTISAWVRSDVNTGNGQCIANVGNERGFSQQNQIILFMMNGEPYFKLTTCPTPSICTQLCQIRPGASGQMPLNTWTHVTGIWDGSTTCKLFINGVQIMIETSLKTTPTLGVRSVKRSTVLLGACGAAGANLFKGAIAQFTIWNRALSDGEVVVVSQQPPPAIARLISPDLRSFGSLPPTPTVQWLFDATSTPANYALSNGIAPLYGSSSLGPSYLNMMNSADNPSSVTGLSDTLSMPLVFGGTSITISMWINIIASQTPVDFTRIWECGTSAGVTSFTISLMGDWSYRADHTNTLYNGQTRSTSVTTKPGTVPAGAYQWHLLTVVWDIEALATRIYLNSALIGFGAWVHGPASIPPRIARSQCLIGRAITGTAPTIDFQVGFIGYWHIALTSQQIFGQYQRPPPGVLAAVTTVAQALPITNLIKSAAAQFTWPTAGPAASAYQPPWSAGILTFASVGATNDWIRLDSQADNNNGVPRTSLPSFAFSPQVSEQGWSFAFFLKSNQNKALITRVLDCYNSDLGQGPSYFSLQLFGNAPNLWRLQSTNVQGLVSCDYTWVNSPLTVDGLWHHYTFQMTSTNLVFLWVDGTLQMNNAGTDTSCSTSSVYSGSQNIATHLSVPLISPKGRDQCSFGGRGAFDGSSLAGLNASLASIHYWTRILTPTEIRLLVVNPPVAGMQATMNASLFTAVAPVTDVTSTANWNWAFTSKSLSGATRAYSLIRAPSGYGSIASFNGVGQWLDLAVTNDNIDGNGVISSPIGGENIALAGWVRWTNFLLISKNGWNARVWDLSESGAFGRLLLTVVQPSDRVTLMNQQYQLRATLYDTGGLASCSLYSQPGTLRIGIWQHYAIIVNRLPTPTMRFYINGGITAIGACTSGFPLSSRSRLQFANYPDATPAPLDSAGMSIWNGTYNVTSDQIFELYRNPPITLAGALGSPLDILIASSSSQLTCPIPLVTTQSIVGWQPGISAGTGLCMFTGLNAATGYGSYIDLLITQDIGAVQTNVAMQQLFTTAATRVGATGGFSVSVHFTTTAYPDIYTKYYLFSCASSTAPEAEAIELAIYQTVYGPQVQWIARNPLGVIKISIIYTIGPWGFPLNEPMHIAGTLTNTPSGVVASLYINGVLIQSVSGGTYQQLEYIQRNRCVFGKWNGGWSGFFKGGLAQFLTFSRGLTAAEVNLLASQNHPALAQRTMLTQYLAPSESKQFYLSRPMTCSNRMQNFVGFQYALTKLDDIQGPSQMSCVTPTSGGYSAQCSQSFNFFAKPLGRILTQSNAITAPGTSYATNPIVQANLVSLAELATTFAITSSDGKPIISNPVLSRFIFTTNLTPQSFAFPTNYTIILYCTLPCDHQLVIDGTVVMTLGVGTNNYIYQTPSVGVHTIQTVSTLPVPAQGYTAYLNVPAPRPCLATTCKNNGTCLNTPSTTYGTLWTCYCSTNAPLYIGALCETPFSGGSGGTNHPTPLLTASSSSTTDCQTLTLDGSQSYNLGPISPMYIWSLPSIVYKGSELVNTTANNYDANLAMMFFPPIVEVANDTSSSNTTTNPYLSPTSFLQFKTPSVSISGLQMIDNATYTFGLAVGNPSEKSSIVTTIVTKQSVASAAWTPSLAIQVPSIIRRPDETKLSAIITPSSCQAIPGDTIYSYSWSIQMKGKADSTSSYPDPTTLPSDQKSYVSTTSSSTTIRSNFFRIGYLYTIRLDLSMSSAKGFKPGVRRRLLASQDVLVALSSTLPTVTVTPSQIVARILGGSRSRYINLPYSISAEQSYDPDYPSTEVLQGVSVLWTCSITDDTLCAFTDDMDLTVANLQVPKNVMTIGVTYKWSVTITSTVDARSAMTFVYVTALAPSSVPVPLVTILNPPLRVNIEDMLRLSATVISQSKTPVTQLTYDWSVEVQFVSGSVPLPDLYNQTNLGAEVNSSALVLLPGLLLPGIYTFTIQVRDPLTIDPDTQQFASAITSVNVIVNAKPLPGTCIIDPQVGLALTTVFTLTCSDWYEPPTANYAPFSYALQYISDGEEDIDLQTGMQEYQQLTSRAFVTSRSFVLPVGSITLRAVITDTVGAFTNYDLAPVTVTLPPIADIDRLGWIVNLTDFNVPLSLTNNAWDTSLSLVQHLGNLIKTTRRNVTARNDMSENSTLISDLTTLFNLTSTLLGDVSDGWELTRNLSGFITTHSMDPEGFSLVSQAFLPLSIDAVTVYNEDVLHYANGLELVVLQTASDSKRTVPASALNNMISVTSNLFINCTQLDHISDFVHEILKVRQKNAVAGEQIALTTSEFTGTVKRSLVAGGVSIVLPSGESVTLTAESAAAYAAVLNERLNATSIDTSGAVGAAEMDTRIVTFAPQWSNCRGSASASQLTSIELTFPDGEPLDVKNIGGIIFTIPIGINQTQKALHDYEMSRACPNDPFDTTQAANILFKCNFWNVTSKAYSGDGCESLGVTVNDDGSATLKCHCNHLTEFAILLAEATAGQCATRSTLGHYSYLAFLSCYAFVGLISLIQLCRVIYYFGYTRFWLISVEHTLICLMCACRTFNMAMFYSLYKSIAVSTQAFISGLPYLFYSWIFTFVIVAWASIWLQSTKNGKERSESLFKPYKTQFLILNTFISILLFLIFASMASTNNSTQLQTLNKAGVALTCIVEFGFSFFFIFYGMLLVRTLTKTYVSPYAKKLAGMAVALSLTFACSACLLAYSVAQPNEYDANFLALNSVYFGLDLVGLLLVIGLFAKRIDGSSKDRKSNTGGSSTGGHSRDRDRSGKSGGRSAGTNNQSATERGERERSTKRKGGDDEREKSVKGRNNQQDPSVNSIAPASFISPLSSPLSVQRQSTNVDAPPVPAKLKRGPTTPSTKDREGPSSIAMTALNVNTNASEAAPSPVPSPPLADGEPMNGDNPYSSNGYATASSSPNATQPSSPTNAPHESPQHSPPIDDGRDDITISMTPPPPLPSSPSAAAAPTTPGPPPLMMTRAVSIPPIPFASSRSGPPPMPISSTSSSQVPPIPSSSSSRPSPPPPIPTSDSTSSSSSVPPMPTQPTTPPTTAARAPPIPTSSRPQPSAASNALNSAVQSSAALDLVLDEVVVSHNPLFNTESDAGTSS